MNIFEDLTLGYLKVGLFTYVDDVDIIEEDMKTVKNLCKKLTVAASKVGLIINEEKIEFMNLNCEDRTKKNMHGKYQSSVCSCTQPDKNHPMKGYILIQKINGSEKLFPSIHEDKTPTATTEK
ncbi:Reverse transcriptase domain [Cinara cedri]|uniref:Reverse transcriptase domain n=1 Tax=Cinara cedri TaxID=506608 RepID=A0A5E4N2F1_9HEMI|nr:Reverse transcriptase domain [Cinara cedri]